MRRYVRIIRAYFLRWGYLLFYGMWKGLCGMDVYTIDSGGSTLTEIHAVKSDKTIVKTFYKEEGK